MENRKDGRQDIVTLKTNIRKIPGLVQAKKRYVIVALMAAAILVLTAVPGLTAEQKKTDVPKPVPPPPAATIRTAEVAMKAAEASHLLRNMNTRLAQSHEIETIEKQISGVSRDIDLQLAGTQKILQEFPPLTMLQTQQRLWQDTQRQMAGWLGALTTRATHLGDALNQLDDLQKTWMLTRASAQASKAPKPALQQIGVTIAALEAATLPLQTQRAAVLDLQGPVGKELARSETVLAQIAQAQENEVAGMLKRERLPIWRMGLWAQAWTMLPVHLREVAAARLADIRQYAHDSSKGMPLHAGLLLGLTLLFWGARRQVARWALAGEGSSFADRVFDRPYAAALLGFLIIVSTTTSSAPQGVRELCRVLAVAPMLRLTRPSVHASLVPGLYALAGLFAVDAVFRLNVTGVPMVGRLIIMMEALAGIIVLGQLLCSGHLRHISTQAMKESYLATIKTVASLILFIFAAGLVTEALGYVRLARLLVPGVLAGGVQALELYALLRVAEGGTAFALRAWPLRLLKMVHHHRDLLERRIYRLLLGVATFIWVVRYLEYIGLLRPVLSLGNNILSAKLERGAISISPGDILAFFLAIWVAYLLSAFIRFVLQEDVYPRVQIAQGLSYAVSSLLNYVILVLGFVVGLAVLGVGLSKVTVLVGAFGVGIGFGLQSIVNNFVSGLILLFERPIQVGDTVELGGLSGLVRRIGIRSSIVHTPQGADIIVPNATFVTEKVTNWTLSDRLRRVDLSVGVNYGAKPEKVMELLEQVAAAHPDVLNTPPPQAFFTGLGDSAINFELRAWTGSFEKWYQIRSDLAVAVYDAVYKAGMTFPYPRREVRLLRDPEVESILVPTAGGSQGTLRKESVGVASSRDSDLKVDRAQEQEEKKV